MGLSAALLYPRLLEGRGEGIYAAFDDLSEAAMAVEDALLKAAEGLGLEYRGIDLSPSPWMDESVARVVEEMLGGSICEPGAGAVVAELEGLVEDTCMDVECTGFNQVMLPVAEDNVLKERVAEGCLDARWLLHLASSCAAGFDMAPVPLRGWSGEAARRILAELVVAQARKGKPLAARVVAVDAAPGEWVDLGRFGRTPVVRLQ